MDRYSIISGKGPKKNPRKEKQELPKRGVPKNVKSVTSMWQMFDKKRSVSFQVSPRDCTCKHCRKVIPKQTPRYKVVEQWGSWDRVEFYHEKRCLPKDVRNWVSRYPKRNLEREDMNDRFNHVVEIIDSMQDDGYREKLVKKIINRYVAV